MARPLRPHLRRNRLGKIQCGQMSTPINLTGEGDESRRMLDDGLKMLEQSMVAAPKLQRLTPC